jgi:hypothetical protein
MPTRHPSCLMAIVSQPSRAMLEHEMETIGYPQLWKTLEGVTLSL